MRSAVAVLSVLLFAAVVVAQDKPPALAGAGQGRVAQPEKNVPAGQDVGLLPNAPARPCPMAQRAGSGPEGVAGHCMMPPGCPMAGQVKSKGCWRQHRDGCCPMRGPLAPCCGHALPLLLLVMGIVNLLLTVIVSMDMAREGRFNGLWIPLLLIAGVPTSIIYALFRIGDKLQGKPGA